MDKDKGNTHENMSIAGVASVDRLLSTQFGSVEHRGAFISLVLLAAQSCPTLCDPMDCSPLVSSVHGNLQARILEWVAISISRGSSLTTSLYIYIYMSISVVKDAVAF